MCLLINVFKVMAIIGTLFWFCIVLTSMFTVILDNPSESWSYFKRDDSLIH